MRAEGEEQRIAVVLLVALWELFKLRAAWDQTVKVARTAVDADGQTVLTRGPGPESSTTTYVQRALDQLRGECLDVTGSGYAPIRVTLNPGGS